MTVAEAVTDAQIEACYPVMRELRPHLEARDFVRIVRDMQRDGYALAYLSAPAGVVAVAGFRVKRTLFCDRFLYVDDLVTLSTERSKGFGAVLLQWLEAHARANGCAELHLDSGLHRVDAHRFYEANSLHATGYHFRMQLESRVPWSGAQPGVAGLEPPAASAEPLEHPSGIPQKIVRKVVGRRGRLHAFETIEAAKTALVVIDLDRATVESNEECRRLVPAVNALASAVRRGGGVVAWVLSSMRVMPPHFAAILGVELATRYFNDGLPEGPGTQLWPELKQEAGDLRALKSGASAFFPGKCDLKAQLDPLGVDTLLIAGAVTNICCESSARDAAELGYKVIMISDALSGHAHGLHEATLATFYRIFGDVRPSTEIIELLSL